MAWKHFYANNCDMHPDVAKDSETAFLMEVLS